jgi:hypothetical protein
VSAAVRAVGQSSCSAPPLPKLAVMDNVSRPLIALLVATVALFALWMIALKPSSSTSSSNPGAYQSAIKAAHQAVTASGAGGHPGTTPTAPASAPGSTPSAPATSHPAAGRSTPSVSTPAASTAGTATTAAVPSKTGGVTVARKHDSAAARHRLNVVTAALERRRVVAMLFYNPAATDDRAVKRELAAVPTHHLRVVSLAVPIGELTRYPVVTTQVPVNESPTLVVIDARRQASTIVGFADRFEIAQRVQDALAVR